MEEKTQKESLLQPIRKFLLCATPSGWLEHISANIELLLIDHANCELKAAQAAVRLLNRYGPDGVGQQAIDWIKPYEDVAYGRIEVNQFLAKDYPKPNFRDSNHPLVERMVLLIREELHHFHQVLSIMSERGVAYPYLSSSRYAQQLQRSCRTHEPARQVDMLIVGAYIEARSCERFAAMLPYVDQELSKFYQSLLRSEARHFEDYLSLARELSDQPIDQRIAFFGQLEAELISQPDRQYRFHSGVYQNG